MPARDLAAWLDAAGYPRSASGLPLWTTPRRGCLPVPLTRIARLPSADSVIFEAFAELGAPMYLRAADSPADDPDLNSWSWLEVRPNVWRVPSTLPADRLADSGVGTAGGYHLSVQLGPEPAGALPADLWRRPAAPILEELRSNGYLAVHSVFYDGIEWALALPVLTESSADD